MSIDKSAVSRQPIGFVCAAWSLSSNWLHRSVCWILSWQARQQHRNVTFERGQGEGVAFLAALSREM